MTDMFKSFGNYLPLINSAITMICLINKPYYCVIFILLLVINYWLNNVLKNQIKEERPTKECDDEEYKETYGMPSKHAQIAVFSLVYLYLFGGKRESTVLFELFIVLLVMFHRVYYREHTVKQVVAGGLFGAIIAFLSGGLFTQN